MGRRHDPQLPLGGHRCELITVTSFLVDVHSSPSALSSFLARRSQDHTCRKADVNDKGRLRNNPQSKIEKNKVARLVVMPAPQANLLGGVNLLFHNGKDKAKDKGKAKGKADTDDTEASVACVCQACSPSAASSKPAVHRMIRSGWPHVKAAAKKVHALLVHLCAQQQDSDQDSDQDMTQVGQDGGGGFDQWTADQRGKCAASIPPRDGRIAQWTNPSLVLRVREHLRQ